MVKDRQTAQRNYRDSIEGHVQGYRNASNAGSISEAAEALQSEFNTGDSLTVDSMVENWADRY